MPPRVRLDAVTAAAVDQARDAAVEVGGESSVGEHRAARAAGDRLVTHTFTCLDAGYPGWEWTVTLARAPRAKAATVCEVELLATADSVVAPSWVPWAERVQPGDLGPGDVLPQPDEDERLECGYAATGDEDVDQLALWELGLGRRRVLSREGRIEAGNRWHDGDFGPESTMARQAAEKCRQCGFLIPMPGSLRQEFGVCTNALSPADGRVISLEYGCGAHSEQQAPEHPRPGPPVVDEVAFDLVAVPHGPQAGDGADSQGAGSGQAASGQTADGQAETGQAETGTEGVEPLPGMGDVTGETSTRPESSSPKAG